MISRGIGQPLLWAVSWGGAGTGPGWHPYARWVGRDAGHVTVRGDGLFQGGVVSGCWAGPLRG